MTSSWVLRAFNHADTSPLAEAFADPVTAQWASGGLVDGDVEGWWTRRNDASDLTHWSRAVSTAEGELLGHVSLLNLNHDQRHGDIGYMVLPHARRRGVARWAVTTACA